MRGCWNRPAGAQRCPGMGEEKGALSRVPEGQKEGEALSAKIGPRGG